MAWSDLTLSRDDIDAFESQTFKDVNVTTGTTVLNLSSKDNLTLDKAKNQLESDVVDFMQDLLNNNTYASETALLDAIEDVDDSELLKDMLTYKFLELWFFQDATHKDSFAYAKGSKYRADYLTYLQKNLRRLLGSLANPQSVQQYKMVSTYG